MSGLKLHMEAICTKINLRKSTKTVKKRAKNEPIVTKITLSDNPVSRAKLLESLTSKSKPKATKPTKTTTRKRRTSQQERKTKKEKSESNEDEPEDRKCFWPCIQCPQIFSSPALLEDHLAKCIAIKLDPCIPYQKQVKKKSPVYEEDDASYGDDELYYFDEYKNCHICSRCFGEFDSESAIEEHIKEHPIFVCHVCEKLFKSVVSLGYHSEEHDSLHNMTCPCCAFQTTSRFTLASHIKDDHSDILKKDEILKVSLKCVVCSKLFYQQSKLLKHQIIKHRPVIKAEPSMGGILKVPKAKTSTSPRVFLCETCGKNFTSKYRLVRHINAMHQGIKPYNCRYCGRAFTGKDTMKKHERIHTGEKPYSCEYCGRCFRQPGPFAVHLRIHTGERPYVCKFCKKGFITNQSKKVHMNNCGREMSFLNILC
ncbi:zinc finger protein 888-like [Sitophilus oryzae]|uniref:Zinc finger protein 888-like n=1 Tax=Sitophilus oryzae TaxID=7048 RepID=A0A6J2XML7_SITOR|nr:zinc finger protein 888-like [Sitophilus oryzae]